MGKEEKEYRILGIKRMTTRFTRSGQAGKRGNASGRGGGRTEERTSGRGGGTISRQSSESDKKNTRTSEAFENGKVKMTILTNKKERTQSNKNQNGEKVKREAEIKATNEKNNNEKKEEVDMSLIDSISEDYINDNDTWNDPIRVQQKIIDLECEISNAKDKTLKENIQKLIDAYQHRLKHLNIENGPKIEQQVEVKKEEQKGANISPPVEGKTYTVDDDGKIEILETPKTREQEKAAYEEIANLSDTESLSTSGERSVNTTEEAGQSTPKRGIDTKNGSGNSSKKKQSRLITPTRDIRACMKPKELWKHHKMEEGTTPPSAGAMLITEGKKKESSPTISNQKTNTSGYKGVLMGESSTNKKETKNLNSEYGVVRPNEIRIAFTHKVVIKKGEQNSDSKKRILQEMIPKIKKVDSKATIVPWKRDRKETKNIHGSEIEIVPKESLSKYVNIPNGGRRLINGRTYYQIGMCIKTSGMNIHQFVDAWSNMKYYSNEGESRNDWKTIRPAEVQHHDQAYAVGYFSGTTERGCYDTLNNQLRDEIDKPVETSFQVVNQSKATPKVWESARETARLLEHNGFRELNRNKFKHAPYALVVYVYDKKHKAEAKKQLMDKYGTLETPEWPTMRDGSKMKFVPIINRPSPPTVEYLTDNLWIQANSKANEVNYELKAWNLKEPQEYLGGKSLEYIIHSKTSSERKGVPLFKHIARKWTENPWEERYEVVIQPNVYQEATKYMQKIQNNLITEYGQKVMDHFNEWKHYKKEKEKNSWEHLDESDDEVDDMISKAWGKQDDYAIVLVEGTETIQEEYNKRMGRKITTRKKEEKNVIVIDENDQQESTNGSIMSGMTSIAGSIKSGGSKVGWEEGIKDNEYTKEKSEKKMEKKPAHNHDEIQCEEKRDPTMDKKQHK